MLFWAFFFFNWKKMILGPQKTNMKKKVSIEFLYAVLI